MPSIITVCTANICRSPMAEAILRQAIKAEPPPICNLKIISAGIAARKGDPASPHALTALKKQGFQLDGHQSQPLTQSLVDDAVAIYCMTETHLVVADATLNISPDKLHLLREHIPGETHREISDPFGGSLHDYEKSMKDIQEAIPYIIKFLRKKFGID